MFVLNFEQGGEPSHMWCYLATGNYFDVLGMKPALGRFFHQADDLQPGASPYVVLSYATWQARFAGDTKTIGATVRINGHTYTVLGVAPRGFHGTEMFYWPELWIPMMMQPQVEGHSWLDERATWDTELLGRLKPGANRSQAMADLNRIAGDLARQHPLSDKGLRMRLAEPGFLGSGIRGAVAAFTGGVFLLAGLVLLVACSNLGGLMLARVTDRQRELAIRNSIGAGRLRIVSQLLTEAFVLAFLGGASGCLLAISACKLFSSWRAPVDFPVQLSVQVDWRVLAFAAAASLLTGLLFGLGPALRSVRTDLNPLLRGSSGVAIFKTRFALRDLLLVAQVAFCFVLVFGCLLSLRGLQSAITLPLGFDPRNAVTAAVDLSSAGYSKEQGLLFQQRAAESLRALPGVSSVAYANSLPLSLDQSTTSVERAGQSDKIGRQRSRAIYYDVSTGLVAGMRMRLLEGRDFNDHDTEHSPPVAIVNQAFARQVLGTNNPVGQTFRYTPGSMPVEVIGLVADGKYLSLTESPQPVVFRAMRQEYNPTTTFVLRSRDSSPALFAGIRQEIQKIDPRLPIYGAGTLESLLGFALFPMHAAAVALSAFGALALLLTVTGIYGLVDYSVARRTNEIGIRIAVGASAFELLRLMLARLLLVTAGLAFGVTLAWLAAPALSAIIYTTAPRDPALLSSVVLALLAAALVSCWKPVTRGLRVNAVSALRCD